MQVESDSNEVKRTAASRVLDLLDAFSFGDGALTLTEISERADLSLATTHRLVQEVLAWGGLDVEGHKRYRLSSKIIRLATTSNASMQLREYAMQHLAYLHRFSGRNVLLAVRDGFDTMYLAALRLFRNRTGENRLGGRLRLHATATGLVLLAYESKEFIERYLELPLETYTERTVTDPGELRTLLRTVRREKYFVADQLLTMAAGSVAAPIYDANGVVCASVSVIYLEDGDDPRQYVDPVRLTANRISATLAEVDWHSAS